MHHKPTFADVTISDMEYDRDNDITRKKLMEDVLYGPI